MTKKKGITATANSLGLTLAEASRLAKGGKPTNDAELLAAPGIVHGYTGDVIPGASVPAAYDLGLRLRAKAEKAAVDRSTFPARFKWTAEAVTIVKETKTTWRTDAGVLDAQGVHDWLYTLVDHPVVPPALHVDKPNSLNTLVEAVKGLKPQPRVLALLSFWTDAAAHAGVGAFIPVLSDLSFRYATARPELEDDIDHWALMLGIPDRGYDAVRALGVALDDEAREQTTMAESWQGRWGYLRRRADDGKMKDLRLSPAAMASSLSSMQAHSDWAAKWTLVGDPLVARAARWTGNVVMSERWVESTPSSWTFSIGEAPCRHRPGSDVTVVLHQTKEDEDDALINLDKNVNVTVEALGYDPDLGTLVTVSCDGRPRSATVLDRAVSDGTMLTLRPTAPNHSMTARASMDAAGRRGRADQRSWLAKRPGEHKPVTRDVPWEILVAAATD